MLDAIEIFLKSAELGNFSAVSRVFDVAPSSVTRQIEKLETELNCRLFHRTTRQLTLTEEGQAFLSYAAQMTEHWQQARSRFMQSREAFSGPLRVSVFESIGRLYVCPVAIEFLKRYPQVEFNLELENRMVDLHKEDVDLAIRSGQPADSSLRARLLNINRYILVASPEYLRKHGQPENPEDLRHHNCLLMNRHRQVNYWYFRKGETQQRVALSGNLTGCGGEVLMQAAMQGLGIGITAHWMALHPLYKKGWVQVLPEWSASMYPEGDSGIYAMYKDEPFQKPALRVFLDMLVEALGETQQGLPELQSHSTQAPLEVTMI
ncbi:MAG: LysR family transcriptional regulator [Hahellaceae bacterium]|nr:LysR family transcriptional regulator [Hahellaceae bacterium]MCP5169000.1 LysR family transcriptional regulator [Hahellaceae bacterium]